MLLTSPIVKAAYLSSSENLLTGLLRIGAADPRRPIVTMQKKSRPGAIFFVLSVRLKKQGFLRYQTKRKMPRKKRGIFYIYLRTGRDSNPRPPP